MCSFTRLYPSVPRMVNPPYWKIFARPKNTVQIMPLVGVDSGRSIWANEMI